MKNRRLFLIILSALLLGLSVTHVRAEEKELNSNEKTIPKVEVELILKGNGDASIHQKWFIGDSLPAELDLLFTKEDALVMTEIETFITKRESISLEKGSVSEQKVMEDIDADTNIEKDIPKEKSGYAYKKSKDYQSKDKIVLEHGLRRLDTGTELFIKLPEHIEPDYDKIEIHYNFVPFMRSFNDSNSGIYRFIFNTPQTTVQQFCIKTKLLDKEAALNELWLKYKASKGIKLSYNKAERLLQTSGLGIRSQINIQVYSDKNLINPYQTIEEKASTLRVSKMETFTKEGLQSEGYKQINYNYFLIIAGLIIFALFLKYGIELYAEKRIPMEESEESLSENKEDVTTLEKALPYIISEDEKHKE